MRTFVRSLLIYDRTPEHTTRVEVLNSVLLDLSLALLWMVIRAAV